MTIWKTLWAGCALAWLATGAGVDEQFAQHALADHKPIIGLETVQEELGFFAPLQR